MRAESQYTSYLDIDLEELDDRMEELQYSLQAIQKYSQINVDLFKVVSIILDHSLSYLLNLSIAFDFVFRGEIENIETHIQICHCKVRSRRCTIDAQNYKSKRRIRED